jgi:very-short-patch-repair endonuclease
MFEESVMLAKLSNHQQQLLLVKETLKKYGYNPTELTFGSPKMISHICEVCGRIKETRFREFVLNTKTTHLKCGYIKRKQTFLKRYGVDNPNKLPEIKEKAAQTCLKRFGVRAPAQCKIVQEKMKHTNLKRYGFVNAFQNKALQEKQRKTNLRRYGVKNVAQSLGFQQKAKQKWLKKRGIIASLENVDLFKKQHIEQFLEKEGYVLLSNSYERCDKKINIRCPHGHSFWMRWMHFKNMGQRCPHCLYKSQTKLQNILNILYPDKTIVHNNNLGFLGKLKVDFGIFDIKLAIEYDGEQHYRPIVGRFGAKTLQIAMKRLQIQQERDRRKDKLCRIHDWLVIRIKYDENLTIDGIKEKIAQTIGVHK